MKTSPSYVQQMSVIVKGQFEATHNWPECPIEEVHFLKYPHRHVFHVIFEVGTTHADRDVEFILLKRDLAMHLHEEYNEEPLGRKSCEDIAIELRNFFIGDYPTIKKIEVWEDDENGVKLIFP